MNEQERLPWSRIVGKKARCVLCLTTLGHRRFIEDIVQILGLPVGARLMLRYRRPYVSPDFWELVKSKTYEPWHALIALGGLVNGTTRFEALRVGEVHRMSIEGELMALEIGLSGYAADGDYVWHGVALNSGPLPVISPKTIEGAASGFFVQALSDCPSNVLVDETVAGWERAADALFKIDTEKHLPFVYHLHGRGSAFRALREAGVLTVESGSQLNWDVHVKCAPLNTSIINPLGEVVIDTSCQPLRMLTSRRIRVDSRRDFKQMTLACDSVFRSALGHLSVKVVLFLSDTTKPGAANERVMISLSRHDIAVRAGQLVPIVASILAGGATTIAMLDKTNWGVFGTAVALCAGVFVFLSLFLGFRGHNS